MIKNDAQKKRTEAQLEGFRSALVRAQEEMSGQRLAAVAGSYQGMIQQLQDELQEYEDLRRGELKLPEVERLDQVAPFITRIRISKGISQTELARRLGVSKQVISRYEESDYQAVSIARLQEILDAVGIRTLVTLGG
jgi:HTH-type transcriptional regulator/antitoxin HigA